MNRRTINKVALAVVAVVVLFIVGASLAGGGSSNGSSSNASSTYSFNPVTAPTTTPKFTVVDLEREMRKDINRQVRALGYATRVRRVLCVAAGPYRGGKEFDCRVEAVGGGSVSKIAVLMPDGRFAYADSQSDLNL